MKEQTKSGVFNDFIVFDGYQVPVQIIVEKRAGYRCSFTKKYITVRVSSYSTKQQNIQHIEACKTWAINKLKQKPNLLDKYIAKGYSSQSTLQTFDHQFSFQFSEVDGDKPSVKLVGSTFYCSLPHGVDKNIVQKKHIARLLSNYYRSFFEVKLNYWNQFFPRKHQNFRLKYNSSNWGSCSSKGNINLSIRLVLCPESVIDYVIVHELAHLIHQNHSIHFWKEVERVLPNYKNQVKWLKTKGANLDF